MRPGTDPPLLEAVDAWLGHLSSTKPARATIAAYRRDIEGVAERIAAADPVGVLHVLHIHDLTKRALQDGFASWASDHAPASVLRAHSAWSRFFDFLVAVDLRDGNPMAAVPKPKRPPDVPRGIDDPHAAERLLATAAVPDPRARVPWPERDRALVATFCVTGIRVGEAVNLDMASFSGAPPARNLVVAGRAGSARSIPVRAALNAALETYLQTRAARFDDEKLNQPSAPLFLDARGCRLSADQINYLIERLYVRAELRARVPPGALVHALRHTFAISALRAGIDIIELQALLGHASLDATRRYIDAGLAFR